MSFELFPQLETHYVGAPERANNSALQNPDSWQSLPKSGLLGLWFQKGLKEKETRIF